MSNLIATDAMQMEPGSEHIELFEFEYDTDTWIYFHPGVDDDLSDIQFRNYYSPSSINTYEPLPVQMGGVEWSADGPQNRPTITVANVLDTFRNAIGNQTAEDLVGKRIIRRRTLKKYLYGESGDSNPPVEWPIQLYILDRIASKNALQIQFELSSPFDLAGLRIPARQIVGKTCPWRYQGAASNDGGCLFPADSKITLPVSSGTDITYAFFDKNDNILLPSGHSVINGSWPSSLNGAAYHTYSGGAGIDGIYLIPGDYGSTPPAPSQANILAEGYIRTYTYSTYSGVTTYDADDLVFYGDHIWKSLHGSNVAHTPEVGSRWWTRADLCSKTVEGCRKRFQYQALITNSTTVETEVSDVIAPHWEPNSDVSNVVPFGGFPASEKF